MTEMVPPPLEASPTARPNTRPDHVLRLYDALREHSGFTARVLPDALVITHSGYAVATDAARVQLPAQAPFAVLRYAIDLLLSRHPHIRAIRARQHGGRVDLEAVHLFDPASEHGTPTG
ncbi:hypothetical protein ACFOSC_26325 [Streptantibioticus rubrisoli]|uniref:Uncharacterized protein n=1 Tax=Streptantibioticus rubrisoli TaxID=1387313 RepID=A0ABT1PEL7_9ACTN|nr:hypothetical protein [Streptantibioticus rubrisoli]MCQ4043804.1 hypothetical protein [Streptantibioticus rubrisoli]